MNSLYLKNNPKVFQGKNKIKNIENYFEGWYFKNTNLNKTISFIPGINIKNGKKSCFIQIITNSESYYIPYSFEDFKFSYNPFFIKIKDNFFSEEEIVLNIDYNNLKVNGNLLFSHNINLKKKILMPNIMGPFSYIPNMECNNAILNLYNLVNGSLKINDETFNFKNGIGYIEKDWGTSFPKNYIWCQGNCFSNKTNTSLFLSIANIPFKNFSFTGFICVLYLAGKEYKFTTYNFAKLEEYKIVDNYVNIVLSRKKYKLIITARNKDARKLLAPQNGDMNIHVSESVNSELDIILFKNNSVVYKDYSTNCGLEMRDI